MKHYKVFVLFMLVLLNIVFAYNVFAVNKAVYPDAKSLQPMPTNTESGAQENMNFDQAQILKNSLDDSGQTLDSKKLEENTKKKNNEFMDKISESGNIMWIFISLLFVILVLILAFRFFKKNKE